MPFKSGMMGAILCLIFSHSLVHADEIYIDFVLSQDIKDNRINEAVSKFRITISSDQKASTMSPLLEQQLRDQASPVIGEINREIVKLVAAADKIIAKKGATNDEKQQAIFALNTKYEVLAEFSKSAVEYELQKKFDALLKEKEELRKWKIKMAYEIIRDTAFNTFALATTIASQGATGPVEVIDFVKRSKQIILNLKDCLISEVTARCELEESLLKYVDQVSAVKPAAAPTTAQRFKDLFTDSKDASLEKKLLLYQYKLTSLQLSLEAMSRQLEVKLDKFPAAANTDEKKRMAYESACAAMIDRIVVLNQERLEAGRQFTGVCGQILSQGRAQATVFQKNLADKRTRDGKKVTAAVDLTLTLASVTDPVAVALGALEKAADEIVNELTRKK